jgi:TetR/AcrR family transcriptional regulator, ethionamide resistance regulator
MSGQHISFFTRVNIHRAGRYDQRIESLRSKTTATPTQKGDARRAAILHALEELLAERSFSEVQIAQISRHAGVTRPGFYFYFPTKAAAVAALIQEVTAELQQAATLWYDGTGDPEPRLRIGFAKSVEVWRRHAALFVAMLDAIGSDRDAGTIWQEFFDGFRDHVAERVHADIGDQLAAAGAPPAQHLATALTAMAFGMMERDVRTYIRNGRGREDTEDALVLAYLRLIYGRFR